MNNKKFDVIVVGAGPAGASAAFTLARAGFNVLIIERGRVPGSKNMFGGRVYVTPLKEIYPDFESKAPIHRWVTQEKISIFFGNDSVSFEFKGERGTSFVTYLSQLTNWMASRAEQEGAILLTEIRVDGFYMEDNYVKGVVSGGDRIYADVVIDAEGINRLLLERAGIVKKLDPNYVALGIKEVIKLSVDDINKMFGLDDREGLAWIIMGDVTNGVPGGAFVYTNRDSISVGLVVLLSEAIKRIDKHISQYVEALRIHPLLYKYFEMGRIIEYSAHLIPEDVRNLMPQNFSYNGLLIAGDAAGLLLNLGYTYRGVDFAAYSGFLAARAYEYAHNEGKYDFDTLKYYDRLLHESFIIKELKKFSGVHDLMKNSRLFTIYPEVLIKFANKLFLIDKEASKVKKAFDEAIKGKVSLLRVLLDLASMVRKL